MSYKSVLLGDLLSRKGSSLLSSGLRSQPNVSNVMQKQVNILLHCFSYNTDGFKIDLCLLLPLSISQSTFLSIFIILYFVYKEEGEMRKQRTYTKGKMRKYEALHLALGRFK